MTHDATIALEKLVGLGVLLLLLLLTGCAAKTPPIPPPMLIRSGPVEIMEPMIEGNPRIVRVICDESIVVLTEADMVGRSQIVAAWRMRDLCGVLTEFMIRGGR